MYSVNTIQMSEFKESCKVQSAIKTNLARFYKSLEKTNSEQRKIRLIRLIQDSQTRLNWYYYGELSSIIRQRKNYDFSDIWSEYSRLKNTASKPTDDVQLFPETWNGATKYTRKPVSKIKFRKSAGKELVQHYRQSMLPMDKAISLESMTKYCEPISALREIETFQATNIPLSEFIDGKFRDRKREECYKSLTSLRIKTLVTSYYLPVINVDSNGHESWSINQIQRIDVFKLHGFQIIRVYSREAGRFTLLNSGKLAPIGVYQFKGVDNTKRLERSRLALEAKKAKKLLEANAKKVIKRRAK